MFGLVKVVVPKPRLAETKGVQDGKSLCVSSEGVETGQPKAIRQDGGECLQICRGENEYVKKQYCDRNAILRGYRRKELSDAEFEANRLDPLRRSPIGRMDRLVLDLQNAENPFPECSMRSRMRRRGGGRGVRIRTKASQIEISHRRMIIETSRNRTAKVIVRKTGCSWHNKLGLAGQAKCWRSSPSTCFQVISFTWRCDGLLGGG